jgi:SHS2 domain-containing protein
VARSRTSTGKPGGDDRQEINEPMAESRVDGSASRTDYCAHEADVGVIGRGATLEDAFAAAAEATLALMVPLAAVRRAVTLRFRFAEADPELALVTWLNRLIGEAQAAGLVVRLARGWACDESARRAQAMAGTRAHRPAWPAGNPDSHPLAAGSGRRGARSLQGRAPGGRCHRESRSGAARRGAVTAGLRQRVSWPGLAASAICASATYRLPPDTVAFTRRW